MSARRLRWDDPQLPSALGRALDRGSVILFPTDTVYGLGGGPRSGAVDRVRSMKDRPTGQPFALHLSSLSAIERFAAVPVAALPWIERLLPGPFTVLLPAARDAPTCATYRGKVGIRVPDHPLFLKILTEIDRALFGTSANRHGGRPLRSVEEVLGVFREVDLAIEGAAPRGIASSVIDLTRDPPHVLRGELPKGDQ